MVCEIGEVQEKGRIGYASHGQEKEKRERERKGVSVYVDRNSFRGN